MLTRGRAAARQANRPSISPKPDEPQWVRIPGKTEIICPIDTCGKRYKLKNLTSHRVSCAKKNANVDFWDQLETLLSIRHVSGVGRDPGHWEQRQVPSVVSSSSRRDDPGSRSGSPQVARPSPRESRITSGRSSMSRSPSLRSRDSRSNAARTPGLYSPSPTPSAAGYVSGRSTPSSSSVRSASVSNISQTAQPGPHSIRRATSTPEHLGSIRPSRAPSPAGSSISRSTAQVIPAKRAPPSTNSSAGSSRASSVGSVIRDAILADQQLFAEARRARQRSAPKKDIIERRSRRASSPLVL